MTDNEVIKIVQTWPNSIKVSEEVRNAKYDICKACEHFVESTKKCGVCSCEMNLLTWSKSMGTCPKGKFKGEAL